MVVTMSRNILTLSVCLSDIISKPQKKWGLVFFCSCVCILLPVLEKYFPDSYLIQVVFVRVCKHWDVPYSNKTHRNYFGFDNTGVVLRQTQKKIFKQKRRHEKKERCNNTRAERVGIHVKHTPLIIVVEKKKKKNKKHS